MGELFNWWKNSLLNPSGIDNAISDILVDKPDLITAVFQFLPFVGPLPLSFPSLPVPGSVLFHQQVVFPAFDISNDSGGYSNQQ